MAHFVHQGKMLFGAREMMNSSAKSNMLRCSDPTVC